MENTFVFQNGQMVASADPFNLGIGYGDDELKAAGFGEMFTAGEDNTFGFTVWDKDDVGWVVVVSTFSVCCVIACLSWPDFIGCLAMLSPSVLACMTDNTDEHNKPCRAYLPTREV